MKDLLKGIIFIGIFLVPFLPIYVENDFFFPFITGKNFAFRIIVEVIFASWILLAFYDPRYRPRFSWILAGFSSLLIVMAAANALGEFPLKSFWSNFERMDGYVTLIHVFVYMLVVASVINTEKLWSYLIHTSIAVALCVAIYGLMQHTGMIEGGRARVDSRLGNAAYMAVYMLFNIFLTFYLFVRAKFNAHRVFYALIALILIYTLILTGTRGTFLGFAFGSFYAVAYVAIFGYKYPVYRKLAAGGFLVLALAAGAFYSVRDAEFMQDAGPLSRLANLDISKDLETRSVIWGMALEGVKERPILGWGQGNFNYVFNEQFEPYLWNKEAWFDRVHNIFLDWLIAGGVLGLIAYLSIFVGAFYYLFWQPMRHKEDEHDFNVLERAVLGGLLIGYFAHNLVVFDNIISYIFFGLVLALIHSRVGQEMPAIQSYKIDERLVAQFVAPIVILLTAGFVYFANVPGLQATADIIDALQQRTVEGRLAEFEQALSRDSFAQQEIVEQFGQNAINVATNKNIPPEEKTQFVQRAEEEMKKMIAEKPGDARLHVFFSSFYRSIGDPQKAQEQAAIARTYSPEKQAIIIEQGIIELQLGNNEAAEEFFKQAYELYETNVEALTLYATALINKGDIETAKELIGEEYLDHFANDNYALSVVQRSDDMEFLKVMYEKRIEKKPANAQNWASLAFIYYQAGDEEGAVKILREAASSAADFGPRAECYIANIEAGNQPDQDCQ